MHAAGTVQVPVTGTHRWVSPKRYRKLPRQPLNAQARAYLRMLRTRKPPPQRLWVGSILALSVVLHMLALWQIQDVLQRRVAEVPEPLLQVRLIEPPPPPPPPPPPMRVLKPVRAVVPEVTPAPEPPPPPEPTPPPPPEPTPEPLPVPVPEPQPIPPVPTMEPEVVPAPSIPEAPVKVTTPVPIALVPVENAEVSLTPAIPVPQRVAPTVKLSAPAPELPTALKPVLQPSPMAPTGLPLPAVPSAPIPRHTIKMSIAEGAAPLPKVYSEIGQIVLPMAGVTIPAGTASGGAQDAGAYHSPLGSGGDASVLRHETPIGYQATIFEEEWAPVNESLLGEAVRKTTTRTSVVTLPDGSTIDCVISPLALAGGCAIANPKQLNHQLVVEHTRDNLAPANPLIPVRDTAPAPTTSVPASPASVPLPAEPGSVAPASMPAEVMPPASQ